MRASWANTLLLQPLSLRVQLMLVLLLGCGIVVEVQAQSPSRDAHTELRAGDEAFARKDFAAAELHYRRAEERAPSFQSAYNLGVALGYLDRPEEAATAFRIARERAEQQRRAADASYNAGTAHIGEQNLEAAVEDYAAALQANPDDEEARYNLSHALRQLRRQQQQQQQQQQQNQQQQQQNQNQDQQNQDQQDQDQQGQQNQDQQQESDQQDQQQQPQQDSPADSQPPNPGENDVPQPDAPAAAEEPNAPAGQPNDPSDMPQDEADRLLRIAAEQERRTNEKMKLGRGERPRSGKDW